MSLMNTASTYFVEDKSKSSGGFTPIPEGKYYAHIHSVEKKRAKMVVDSRNEPGETHSADLLEVVYTIAEGDYKGRKVWSNAIWIFHNPTEEDSFVANPSGNYRYSKFLEVVNYPMNKVKVQGIDGEEKEVNELPLDLASDECVGKPCLITVKERTYTSKDGEKKVASNESEIHEWAEGKAQEMVADDDLPF